QWLGEGTRNLLNVMHHQSESTASAIAETATRVRQCPVCDSDDVYAFLERQRVPVHQNLVADSREAALAVPTGKLSMCICRACGFVYNATFELHRMSYD